MKIPTHFTLLPEIKVLDVDIFHVILYNSNGKQQVKPTLVVGFQSDCTGISRAANWDFDIRQ